MIAEKQKFRFAYTLFLIPLSLLHTWHVSSIKGITLLPSLGISTLEIVKQDAKVNYLFLFLFFVFVCSSPVSFAILLWRGMKLWIQAAGPIGQTPPKKLESASQQINSDTRGQGKVSTLSMAR